MSKTPSRYQDDFAYSIFSEFVKGNKSAAVRLVQTARTKEQVAFLSASVAVLLSTMANEQGALLSSEFAELLRAKEAQ